MSDEEFEMLRETTYADPDFKPEVEQLKVEATRARESEAALVEMARDLRERYCDSHCSRKHSPVCVAASELIAQATGESR